MGHWPTLPDDILEDFDPTTSLTDETWPNAAIDYLYAASTPENLEIAANML